VDVAGGVGLTYDGEKTMILDELNNAMSGAELALGKLRAVWDQAMAAAEAAAKEGKPVGVDGKRWDGGLPLCGTNWRLYYLKHKSVMLSPDKEGRIELPSMVTVSQASDIIAAVETAVRSGVRQGRKSREREIAAVARIINGTWEFEEEGA